MTEHLPLVNASLNGLSTVLLLCGFVFIKQKKIAQHKAMMISALVSSALFLCTYLLHKILSRGVASTAFPHNWLRPIYLWVVLLPHTILAIGMLPLIAITFNYAFKDNFAKHRKIAIPTYFIWLYVSITGVLIYVLLYQVAPRM